MFRAINKFLVRLTTLSLVMLTVKVSWIYLVPMAVLMKTHRSELLPSQLKR
ncbi:hypothetical protein [Enterovibrio paralichthyis]|uniref:hypothetical protein n=1 Tax=Enterovibrio paralichthyis TaxID=2853805 RepID=UPI000ABB337E|nr:hypothetical protein [Enterovibrio paralichthyis]MBV7298832.1 hypothetical protein [Enterovibrio paralichthyis]